MALPPRLERTLARVLKPAVWIGGLLPLAMLLFAGFTGTLEADPVKDITHRTGKATLQLLFATLAVTPLRRLTGWNGIIQARRPLGLFAFFYGCLHFCIYLGDQGFSPGYIVADVVKHTYVTAGFAALCLMAPLAVTSTRGWQRKLGKRWQKLHRLIYLSGALGVLHYIWSQKKDISEPLMYAAFFGALLAARVPVWLADRRKRRERTARPLATRRDAAA